MLVTLESLINDNINTNDEIIDMESLEFDIVDTMMECNDIERDICICENALMISDALQMEDQKDNKFKSIIKTMIRKILDFFKGVASLIKSIFLKLRYKFMNDKSKQEFDKRLLEKKNNTQVTFKTHRPMLYALFNESGYVMSSVGFGNIKNLINSAKKYYDDNVGTLEYMVDNREFYSVSEIEKHTNEIMDIDATVPVNYALNGLYQQIFGINFDEYCEKYGTEMIDKNKTFSVNTSFKQLIELSDQMNKLLKYENVSLLKDCEIILDESERFRKDIENRLKRVESWCDKTQYVRNTHVLKIRHTIFNLRHLMLNFQKITINISKCLYDTYTIRGLIDHIILCINNDYKNFIIQSNYDLDVI